jgi:3-isopropylmalate/(R)-2-methylmalate dehydratase small subunit
MPEPIRTFTARSVVLPGDHVDTDQIVPARFLTGTSRDGLGRALFADRRGPGFALDEPAAAGAGVLLAGQNFGCGSSREHAVWALVEAGFRAVVAPSIGDIFRQNAQKNGLVPVVLPPPDWRRLVELSPGEVRVDVEALVVTLPDGSEVPFELDPFARYRLLHGVDELDLLLAAEAEITRFEEARPWFQ